METVVHFAKEKNWFQGTGLDLTGGIFVLGITFSQNSMK